VKKELYAMKQLNHDNISRFIGACIEPGHVCIVTQYCSRGSLRVPAVYFVALKPGFHSNAIACVACVACVA